MPKLVKTKNGYKVIHKYTGKTLHTYKGKGALAKATKVVKAGY